jgi:putative transcriptional regulator
MGVVRSSLFIGSILLLGVLADGIHVSDNSPALTLTQNHPLTLAAEPAPGRFLVARRSLDDPHFRQTVIYLVRHDPSGSAGLIINRPSGLNLSDAISGIDDTDLRKRPIYFGGPVEFNTVSMLIRNDKEGRLVEHIADDIYLSGDRAVLDRLITEKKPGNALHFYLGHAGWTAGQLAQEVDREEWYVVDTDPVLIFSAAPETIWKRLIEKLDPSGRYAAKEAPAAAAGTPSATIALATRRLQFNARHSG